MFIGDLFLYAHWGDIPSPDGPIQDRIPGRASILLASETHLEISILLGGFAIVGYALGAIYLQRRFTSEWKLWGIVTGICFGIASVLGGIYHALWSFYGRTLQAAISAPLLFEDMLHSHRKILEFTNTIAAIPLLASFVLFGIAVIFSKTDLPRHTALITPLPLLLLYGAASGELVEIVGSPLNAIIRGTGFNFVMLVFFAISYKYISRLSPESSKLAQKAT